jgi:hypothetical protein
VIEGGGSDSVTRVRNSVRALLVLSCLPLTALLTVPALAAVPNTAVPDTAYDAGPGLTVPETLGIFVGIPLLVMGIIYALVYALTGRRGPRYPAGQPWTAEPEWFGAQPPGQPQVEAGASSDSAGPADSGGGARGRW